MICSVIFSNSYKNSLLLATVISIQLSFSTGFIIPTYYLDAFNQLIAPINFTRLCYEALILNIFKGACSSLTPIAFSSFDLNENDLIKNIYMIFIIGISLRLIGLIIMLFKANRDLIFFIKQKVLKMFKRESSNSSVLSTKF